MSAPPNTDPLDRATLRRLLADATPMHIRQQDENGCMVACLAMVTGQTYEQVRDDALAMGKTLGTGGGLIEHDLISYLTDRGYAVGRKYKWFGMNVQRDKWPADPFAPVHICAVNGPGRHGVVLLADGRVFDPMFDEPRQFSDYADVAYMLGVWNVSHRSSALLDRLEQVEQALQTMVDEFEGFHSDYQVEEQAQAIRVAREALAARPVPPTSEGEK